MACRAHGPKSFKKFAAAFPLKPFGDALSCRGRNGGQLKSSSDTRQNWVIKLQASLLGDLGVPAEPQNPSLGNMEACSFQTPKVMVPMQRVLLGCPGKTRLPRRRTLKPGCGDREGSLLLSALTNITIKSFGLRKPGPIKHGGLGYPACFRIYFTSEVGLSSL